MAKELLGEVDIPAEPILAVAAKEEVSHHGGPTALAAPLAYSWHDRGRWRYCLLSPNWYTALKVPVRAAPATWINVEPQGSLGGTISEKAHGQLAHKTGTRELFTKALRIGTIITPIERPSLPFCSGSH